MGKGKVVCCEQANPRFERRRLLAAVGGLGGGAGQVPTLAQQQGREQGRCNGVAQGAASKRAAAAPLGFSRHVG